MSRDPHSILEEFHDGLGVLLNATLGMNKVVRNTSLLVYLLSSFEINSDESKVTESIVSFFQRSQRKGSDLPRLICFTINANIENMVKEGLSVPKYAWFHQTLLLKCASLAFPLTLNREFWSQRTTQFPGTACYPMNGILLSNLVRVSNGETNLEKVNQNLFEAIVEDALSGAIPNIMLNDSFLRKYFLCIYDCMGNNFLTETWLQCVVFLCSFEQQNFLISGPLGDIRRTFPSVLIQQIFSKPRIPNVFVDLSRITNPIWIASFLNSIFLLYKKRNWVEVYDDTADEILQKLYIYLNGVSQEASEHFFKRLFELLFNPKRSDLHFITPLLRMTRQHHLRPVFEHLLESKGPIELTECFRNISIINQTNGELLYRDISVITACSGMDICGIDGFTCSLECEPDSCSKECPQDTKIIWVKRHLYNSMMHGVYTYRFLAMKLIKYFNSKLNQDISKRILVDYLQWSFQIPILLYPAPRLSPPTLDIRKDSLLLFNYALNNL